MTCRPNFHDLSPDERVNFGNGVGPGFFPAWLRKFITGRASRYFKSASWRHHDFGYAVGGDAFDRFRCDWKFFKAMLRDSVNQRWHLWPFAAPVALVISVAFFIAVAAGGWSSFSYRKSFRTLDEVRELQNEQQCTPSYRNWP